MLDTTHPHARTHPNEVAKLWPQKLCARSSPITRVLLAGITLVSRRPRRRQLTRRSLGVRIVVCSRIARRWRSAAAARHRGAYREWRAHTHTHTPFNNIHKHIYTLNCTHALSQYYALQRRRTTTLFAVYHPHASAKLVFLKRKIAALFHHHRPISHTCVTQLKNSLRLASARASVRRSALCVCDTTLGASLCAEFQAHAYTNVCACVCVIFGEVRV